MELSLGGKKRKKKEKRNTPKYEKINFSTYD